MSGVYISYPFCSQKCSFCNFASDVAPQPVRQQYERRLLRELTSHQWQWTPETLYFGGGTPSLMKPETLNELLSTLPQRNWREATVECAPGTVAGGAPDAWLHLGINRVSLGVQSAVETELRAVGRRHTAATVSQDVERLRRAGFENLNLDLIAGLPGQTAASWQQSLAMVEALDLPHVSIYLFEVDEDSRLGLEVLEGGSRYGAGTVPADDLVAELFETAVSRLQAAGYVHYEISNFARPGFESHHNLKYWRLEPYVGFGLDAHSFDGQRRWSNPDNLPAYLSSDAKPPKASTGRDAAPPDERGTAMDLGAARESVVRSSSLEETANLDEERFFIGLRMLGGIHPDPREREHFAEPIAKWKSRGLLIEENGTLRLAPQAVLVSNEILADFVLA